MFRYFGEKSIKDLGFSRVVNSITEDTTIYTYPGRQLKFAVKSFKERIFRSGYQVVIVDSIEEIDQRIRSKLIVMYNCETACTSRKDTEIKEFVDDCKSRIGINDILV
jgi:hypothetical protein